MLLVWKQEGHSACKNWFMGCWHGYLSWARCRFAYGPADATATHYLVPVNLIGITFLVPAHLGGPGQMAIKRLLLLFLLWLCLLIFL